MTVRIVTDSTSDIPPELAAELGITVVPIYVRFGTQTYRDGVDIEPDRFFEMLVSSPFHPATSQPTPEDFELVYSDLCGESDGIVSIHISSRISGTYNSAEIARNNLASKCPIEIIDSGLNSCGLALVVLAAARAAREGKDFESVLRETHTALEQCDMFGVFATMTYLARGGRINRTISMAANFLNVMPLLTFHKGEIVRAGLARSISRGIDRLVEFAESKKDIRELVVVHAAAPFNAEKLRKRLAHVFPEENILTFSMGAGLGVHGGPGVLLVGTRAGNSTATP